MRKIFLIELALILKNVISKNLEKIPLNFLNLSNNFFVVQNSSFSHWYRFSLPSVV